jgi:hypothetical protein
VPANKARKLLLLPLVAVIIAAILLAILPYRVSLESDNKLLSISTNTAYASPDIIDISNIPPSYDFGIVTGGSTPVTGLTYFTVTNNSDTTVSITIGANDFTGGVGWALSDNATPGVNTVGLKAGKVNPLLTVGFTASPKTVGMSGGEQQPVVGFEGQGDYTIIIKETSPNYLIRNVPIGGSLKWGFKMWTPTSFSDGAQKEGKITLTASAP